MTVLPSMSFPIATESLDLAVLYSFGKSHYAADFDALVRLELKPCDRRTARDSGDSDTDAEVSERCLEFFGVPLRLKRINVVVVDNAVAFAVCGFEKVERREYVLALLFDADNVLARLVCRRGVAAVRKLVRGVAGG